MMNYSSEKYASQIFFYVAGKKQENQLKIFLHGVEKFTMNVAKKLKRKYHLEF